MVTYSHRDCCLLLLFSEEVLIETVVLEQTASDVSDGVYGHIIGKTLECTCLAA